jgi:hypothetical protein
MGFFKDMAKLTKMGVDELNRMDVKGTLADAQQRMDALIATTGPASDLGAGGVDAVATVVRARDTGVLVNGMPTVEAELMVLLPTGVPVQVTRSVTASPLHLYRLQPGRQVDVRLDPTDAQNTLQLAF